ncbi:hypothetical protein [Streptomyces mexicanus]|uniref:hypothetical protein n=1 Tax=Streptomyces mexicanus TaxID=178566 RepID=UPI0036AC361E
MHRLLPPSAIAGVSLVCAVGPWVSTTPAVLRLLAAAAAVTAVSGAVVMRRWDAQAGRKVADLTRARASDEWRFEERLAELEADLEESRELRVRLENRLRAKRSELAGLRNEHAALLRRYATAETERASALEGRRLLELGAGSQSRALPAAAADRRPAARELAAGVGAADTAVQDAAETQVAALPALASPQGAELFRRAGAALARFAAPEAGPASGPADKGAGAQAAPAGEDDLQGRPRAVDAPAHAAAAPNAPAAPGAQDIAPRSGAQEAAARSGGQDDSAGSVRPGPSAAPAGSARPPAGHFAVPTAVAVVPAAPAPRPVVEGGFDFFGTKGGAKEGMSKGTKKAASPAALEAVQNEDLADVVGQEALAAHKADAESGYKQPGADSGAVSQVIDLTAHDETEQIDVQGLRSAAS